MPMSREIAIRARGLGKMYRTYRRPEDRVRAQLVRGRRYHEEFWAVRGVDLSVGRGETVGLVGRNGSGKSTLLQLICGTVRPSSGEIEVRGRIGALLELGAGFNPEFTGRENLWVIAAVLGLTDRQIAERFDAIAEFAGIGEYMDQPVKHYSSGMYARLAFSVYAHIDADILVVDEALSVGDAGFQQKCMRFLNDFRRRGALLFVSHDLAAVTKLCDRVLWLERGAVRAEGSAKDVCRRYQAAMSEESAEESEGFRLGGRGWDPPAPPQQAEGLRIEEAPAADAPDFDADEPGPVTGGAQIVRAGFYTQGGRQLDMVSGGEEIELRIDCRAEQPLSRPTVAFLLRDRLGQGLFGDSTYLTYAGATPRFAHGQTFSASFKFQLPYLPTGQYAVEFAVYDGMPEDHRILARLQDAVFLLVQSTHPSAGLLNVVTRSTTLVVDGDDAAATSRDSSAVAPS
jgi:lipopolysaccharide transport system ATP-binding protein